jgi:hypothetical protein
MSVSPTEAMVATGPTTLVAPDALYSYSKRLLDTGTVEIPPNVLFNEVELEQLDLILTHIPEERVSNGDSDDEHDVYVRRIATDRAGEPPVLVNRPFSDHILEVLSARNRTAALTRLFESPDAGAQDSESPYCIRRCQMHRMVEGSFVGVHLDAESNPDNEFSVILQLGSNFKGGEFVVYPDGQSEEVFTPEHGTVLITTCRYRHEVKPVLANERRSLVYFYSTHDGENRRDATAACSRPNCRWCKPGAESVRRT